MARPRTYDTEEALDRAVRVFWARGYRDTSIQDLVEGTGVQRYGLYESFGDKRRLFLSALRRYEAVWVTGILGDVESPAASLPELFAVFDRLADAVDPEDAPMGCLLCNTAAEMGGEDVEADAVVGGYVSRLQNAFRGALERARLRGEIDASLDPKRHAAYLTGVVVGASVYAKTPAGTESVQALLQTAVASLE